MKKKNKRKINDVGCDAISVFLSRDLDGDYSVFGEEPYFDYEWGMWKGKVTLLYGIDEDIAKKYLKLTRHLTLGNKGITKGLLNLGFKKLRNKYNKKSPSIFNKPIRKGGI